MLCHIRIGYSILLVHFYFEGGYATSLTLFSSIAQSCPTLRDPMNCSTLDFLVHLRLPELAQTHIHQVSDGSNLLILRRPLFRLPSILPSIGVFSNETVLHIRWPKYWSFSFGISPSNEYSGLISLRTDWFDLIIEGTVKSLIQHHSSKASLCSFLKKHHILWHRLSEPTPYY